jgi:hypothetical protein
VQRGEPVLAHGGSWQGFRAAIARYPGRKLTVIVLANLAEAEPERLAAALAGMVEPALAWPDVRAVVADPDPARTARLSGVLQSWARGEPSAAMAAGLRSASIGTTQRDLAGREELQQQLAQSRGFTFLAEDDERGRGLELRGENISRVVFYLMPGERDHRFRFFLTDAGEVAEFSSEPVD